MELACVPCYATQRPNRDWQVTSLLANEAELLRQRQDLTLQLERKALDLDRAEAALAQLRAAAAAAPRPVAGSIGDSGRHSSRQARAARARDSLRSGRHSSDASFSAGEG